MDKMRALTKAAAHLLVNSPSKAAGPLLSQKSRNGAAGSLVRALCLFCSARHSKSRAEHQFRHIKSLIHRGRREGGRSCAQPKPCPHTSPQQSKILNFRSWGAVVTYSGYADNTPRTPRNLLQFSLLQPCALATHNSSHGFAEEPGHLPPGSIPLGFLCRFCWFCKL